MYIFRLKIHTHRRYVKKPSAGAQVSTGANEKRFINKTYIYRFLKQRSFASSRGTHSKTGKNTMKPLIRILSLWLAALCFGACTDDDLIDGTPTPEPETGIVIRLSAGDLEQTRTELTSQANLQHVEKVYALLYKGHGDTATFYACDELNWNPKDSTDNTGVQEQRKEFLLPQSKNLAKGAYTVLCVGLDDESGETYGLTPDKMQGFSTLKDAKATLAQDKGKEDIAKSELFAGWNQFHFAPDSLNIVEVEMKRRVAGVLCYLTDVPYQLTQDNKTYRITSVELWLYTKQNTGIKLCREEITGGGYPEDFGYTSGGDLEGSELIGQQSMINSGFGVNADKTLYTRDKQTITTTDGREVTIKENSILMGAYLIPIDYDGTKSTITDANLKREVTLQVALRGVEVASINEDITDEKIKGAQIVRSFPAFNDDIDLDIDNSSGTPVATPSYTYPIRPNIIYHIGNKPSDEEEGTPESLAGTKVNIVAEEWTDQEINVEFPSVPIMATMELLDENDRSYDTDYVFDCIGIIDDNIPYASSKVEVDDKEYDQYYQGYQMAKRLTLRIHSSVLKDKWSLSVAPSDNNQTMLYRYDGSDYVQPNFNSEEHGNVHEQDTYDIPLIMTDYVDENQSPDDIRSVTLRLTSGQGRVDSMTIQQYNAIIIEYKEDNETKKLGFSHYDWGTQGNTDGTSATDGKTAIWNYLGTTIQSLFGVTTPDATYKSGSINYANALGQIDSYTSLGDPFYHGSSEGASGNGSALYKAAIPRLEAGQIGTSSSFWFLPAYNEMEKFLEVGIDKDSYINWNIKDKRKYWTSSVGYLKTSFNIYIDDDKGNKIINFDHPANIPTQGVSRDKDFYMRQACVVGGDND